MHSTQKQLIRYFLKNLTEFLYDLVEGMQDIADCSLENYNVANKKPRSWL
jgi:hypothetical protein